MSDEAYWEKRAEYIANLQFNKTDNYILDLDLEYKKALESIQKEIDAIYNKCDINNMTCNVKMARLKELKAQINRSMDDLYNKQHKDTAELLKDIYSDTYYRNIFEVFKGLGIGIDFAKIDNKVIEKVLKEPWNGSNYSDRIWKNKQILIKELQSNLTQSFIRGDSIDKTSKIIANKMNVAIGRARMLVNTESAYITSKATLEGYSSSGVLKQYEILATLDLHTSNKCRSMDGKVFDLAEKKIGINAPPFHPNCRSTTMPYFDDAVDEERIAREPVTGKTKYVPGNMKYEDWYKEHVSNNPKAVAEEKKIQNRSSDKKQHKKYLEVLKDMTPKIFDKFQNLKYNNVNEWNELNSTYKVKASPKIKRDGAVRAQEFSQFWQEASLKEALDKMLPEYETLEKPDKSKIIYSNKNSNIQIVHDTKGNYFRIEDLNIKGKRRYLDLAGNNASNKIENGRQKGRSKEEYEALTHFKNKDGESNE